MILGGRDPTMRKLTRGREADATGGGDAPSQGRNSHEGWLVDSKAAISSATGDFPLSDLDVTKTVIIN